MVKKRAGYYFYDLNAKINHSINKKNKVYLSAYSGNDKAYAESQYAYKNEFRNSQNEENLSLRWGNITTAIRWNSIVTNKLFSNVTATYSQYKFRVSADAMEIGRSRIQHALNFIILNTAQVIRDFA
jgi:hypothetical protein